MAKKMIVTLIAITLAFSIQVDKSSAADNLIIATATTGGIDESTHGTQSNEKGPRVWFMSNRASNMSAAKAPDEVNRN